MGKPSHRWLRYLASIVRYYASIMAFAIIATDILLIYNIQPTFMIFLLGPSLLSCVLNYICVRAFNYCYVQRHLIWVTAYNVIYNYFVMRLTWRWEIVGEILFAAIVFIGLIWTIVHYIFEFHKNDDNTSK